MKTIIVKQIIKSELANDTKKGDLVFNEIKECFAKGEEVVLDFGGISIVNTAFLNNAIGRLFDPEKFNLDETPVKIQNMNNEMLSLLKESVKTARTMYAKTSSCLSAGNLVE